MNTTPKMTYVVGGKYTIHGKIGEGAFGKIFSGKNKNTDEDVAVKIERSDSNSPLRNEARIYSALRGISGIPNMRTWGNEGKFNYLVLDLLGESLEKKRNKYGGVIPLSIVVNIAQQMLSHVSEIHGRGIIHRDIKPSNFLFGTNTHSDTLYVIDFGLAKSYLDNGRHIDKREGRSVIGTARFISINTHDGITPSRRDDIESLGYIMLYLLLGDLPWKEYPSQDDINRQSIGALKKSIDLWKFSNENNIPGEIITFIEYSRNLGFEQEPNYSYLTTLLMRINI